MQLVGTSTETPCPVPSLVDGPHGFVGDLDRAGQLMVWALRRANRIDRTAVPSAFLLAFGICRVETALAAFEAMLAAWLHDGRRRPRIGRLGDARVTADERAFLALLAAHQAADVHRAVALARWLVRAPGHLALAGAGERLAELMAERGFLFD